MSSLKQTRGPDNASDGRRLPRTKPVDSQEVAPALEATSVKAARFKPSFLTSGSVSQLQRSIGNQVVAGLLAGSGQRSPDSKAVSEGTSQSVVQRVPYAKAYTVSSTRSLLNDSDGRASPVNNQAGHPRQHVGKWEKAEKFADEQSKTKSVYTNTGEQDKAIHSALLAAAGQTELAKLDANPAQKQRVAIKNVATTAAEVQVVQAKKKKDTGAVKSWNLKSGTSRKRR